MKMKDLITWKGLLFEVTKSFARYNIPADKQNFVYAGYEEIKNVMGKEALKYSSNSIVPALYNMAPWSLLKNATFGHKLAAMKGKTNFEHITQRLIMNDFVNSYGAEAEIEVAGDLLKSGFFVELIEPEQKKQKVRRPDFKVKYEESWVNFEITTFRTWSEKSIQAQKFEFELRTSLIQMSEVNDRFVEVDFNGMSVECARLCADQIKSEIIDMFQSEEESDCVVSGIRIHALNRDEGLGIPNIQGLSFAIDELSSISGKFLEKIERKQLPSGEYGVVLVFTRTPFLPDFKALACKLKEVIKADPDLNAAVIEYVSHKQIDIPLGDDYFSVIRGASYDGLSNHYYIIILQNDEDSDFSDCLSNLFGLSAGATS